MICYRVEFHKEHTACVESFVQMAQKRGKDIKIKMDSELEDNDADGVDLVISLGGDHTYLRASAMAANSSIPVWGIDTNESFTHSQLSGNSINYKHRQDLAEKLMLNLDKPENREFNKRTRILFEVEQEIADQKDAAGKPLPPLKLKTTRLCLNEVFLAEKDVASASRYRVVTDGNNLGMFKSSGFIVSTGVGSTGWLYAARQMIPQKLEALAHKVGGAI